MYLFRSAPNMSKSMMDVRRVSVFVLPGRQGKRRSWPR
jgi:hypothetical protein